MFKNIFSTRNDWAGLVLRVTLGIVMFAHGAQKLLGWFGGYGFDGSMQYFTQTMNLPWIVGFLVILIESIGALFLILGLGTRLMAVGTLGVMAGVVLLTNVPNGFYMNWYGTAAGEGMEFGLLAIGLAAGIALNGAGKFSLDSVIYKSLAGAKGEKYSRVAVAG